MPESDLKNIFAQRIESFNLQFQLLDRKHNSLSLLRVIIFTALAVLIVYSANSRSPYLLVGSTFALFIAFGVLVQIHNRVKFNRLTSRFSKELNQEELARLEGNRSKISDGKEFGNKDHFYATDLDIFGSNSLFQLLLRSRIEGSQKLAAQWLLEQADQSEIISRQLAAKELLLDIDWRQKFSALGMHTKEKDDRKQINQEEFLSWVSTKTEVFDKLFWKIVGFVMPIVGAITLVLILFFGYPYQLIFGPILVNVFFLKVIFGPLLDLTKKFDVAVKVLKSYETLFVSIENRRFENEKLANLRRVLISDDHQASSAIKSLRQILNQLLNRANMLYFPLNMVFLLDLIWLLKAEKWKQAYGSKLASWFETVHEIDVLNDISSLAYSNPDFTFPEIVSEDYKLECVALGHPLIHNSGRVTNNFDLSETGQIGLVTGSNMSGKSTFLRTVGLNLVMAQAGLPVCASSYKCSLTRVFSSMRTEDNLEEHISSFYAELSRIKMLLDSISGEPVFYLLDEILKGTNSEDRHKGSIALIEQLTRKNGTGLISTHDLTLSNLKNEKVTNYSFNSEIIGDEIIFDYKLTEGPCRSFNASKLMEKMGIIV